MKPATLGLLIDDTGVWLAEKKKGEIGIGILSGPGGKLDDNETLPECLIRETKEEWDITLIAEDVVQVAHIIFYAGGVPDFDVHIYRVRRFEGTPKETKEASMPEHFAFDALPFDRMYDGDRHWFTRALSGEPFTAHVYYKERAKEFDRVEFLPPDF